MKYPKALNSVGDTIVEVLIVLGVLSLAFAMASATASKGLSQSRNAEEHSQALGTVSSQLELLRAAVANQTGNDTIFSGSPFCMNGTTPVKFVAIGYHVDPDATNDNFASYPPACQNGLYNQSIVYVVPDPSDPGKNYFEFRSRWDGNSGLGRQQELFNYRITQLTGSVNTIGVSNTPAQVTVNVLPLQPSSDTVTPSCADPTGGSHGGASVSLQQTNGGGSKPAQTTGASSSTVFTGLTDGGTYRALAGSLPSGFTLCGSNPSATTTVGPANASPVITMTMYPKGWWAYGNAYNHPCLNTDPFGYVDGLNGCFDTGNSTYSRRSVNITYNMGTNFPGSTQAYLVIHYNQHNSNGSTWPPSGYNAFQVTAKVGASDPGQSVTLPIPSDSSSWNDRSSGRIPVNIPAAGASTLELDWTNNNGSDPDLQINSVQLFIR